MRKTREGASHPDRDDQFWHINRKAHEFQAKGEPVISVDTKKKELVGDFHVKGKEWQPQGKPETVRTHDFIDRGLGKAIPYGVTRNEGWVNVGIDHDTAEFAVESIRRWWWRMGRYAYPDATELLITADGGGSNGYRTRLWKVELQKFARDAGLRITVAHYPPGTSKWNKIEHRMFSFITLNWRGRSLLRPKSSAQLKSPETSTLPATTVYPPARPKPCSIASTSSISAARFKSLAMTTARPALPPTPAGTTRLTRIEIRRSVE